MSADWIGAGPAVRPVFECEVDKCDCEKSSEIQLFGLNESRVREKSTVSASLNFQSKKKSQLEPSVGLIAHAYG